MEGESAVDESLATGESGDILLVSGELPAVGDAITLGLCEASGNSPFAMKSPRPVVRNPA